MPTDAAERNTNPEYADRYVRQRQLGWWNQRLVSQAKVIVAGAGAIGNEVIKLLSLMGANNLLIIDFDTVDTTNLTRSILFRDGDVGKSKARTAAARAREINPESRAIGVDGDLEFDLGLGIYRSADIVIGCLDSINARLALNRACLRAGVPWLNGGIEASFGEVALHSGDSACFECGMSDSMWQRRNARYSCTGQLAQVPPDSVPTTATVASIVAAFLVNEAMLHIHSKQDRISPNGLRPGQKMLVTLNPYDLRVADLARNPECMAHECWAPVIRVSETPEKVTPLQLLKRFGDASSRLELGFDLLTGMTCVDCGRTEEILRPVEKSAASLSLCPACGKETRRPSSCSWIDRESPLACLPVTRLCIASRQIVAIAGTAGRQYIEIGGPDLFGESLSN